MRLKWEGLKHGLRDVTKIVLQKTSHFADKYPFILRWNESVPLFVVSLGLCPKQKKSPHPCDILSDEKIKLVMSEKMLVMAVINLNQFENTFVSVEKWKDWKGAILKWKGGYSLLQHRPSRTFRILGWQLERLISFKVRPRPPLGGKLTWAHPAHCAHCYHHRTANNVMLWMKTQDHLEN